MLKIRKGSFFILYKTSRNAGTGKKIDSKPGSQTQLNKVNMKMSKNSNNDVARANYGIILILALFINVEHSGSRVQTWYRSIH